MNEVFVAIVNGAAGGGRSGKLAPAALERLRSQGLDLDVRMTSGPGDATRIAAGAARDGHRRFIAVGGDGTAFEVVNGLSAHFAAATVSGRVSLGFLPLGTGNSFLRDFGCGDLEHAIAALAQRRRRACDVHELARDEGTLHFINLLSMGFVADVGREANARWKSLGVAGYALSVLTTVAKLHAKPLSMRLDGGRDWAQDAILVSFNNSRFTGGHMMMAPYADTSDGELDVVVCGALSRGGLLATFPKIFRGQHVHHHAVVSARAKVVEILDAVPTDLMIDGEVIRGTPRRIEVIPRAIDVFV